MILCMPFVLILHLNPQHEQAAASSICIKSVGESFFFFSLERDAVLLLGDCSHSRCQKCWEAHFAYCSARERRIPSSKIAHAITSSQFRFLEEARARCIKYACGVFLSRKTFLWITLLQRRRKSDLQRCCVRELFMLRRRRQDWWKNSLERQHRQGFLAPNSRFGLLFEKDLLFMRNK
jgi:hypothetical protein